MRILPKVPGQTPGPLITDPEVTLEPPSSLGLLLLRAGF